jgi:hypothetical protein
MDPNENLREQRRLLKKINEYIPAGDDTEYVEDLVSLATLAESMDEWLSRRGFLPDAWKGK